MIISSDGMTILDDEMTISSDEVTISTKCAEKFPKKSLKILQKNSQKGVRISVINVPPPLLDPCRCMCARYFYYSRDIMRLEV